MDLITIEEAATILETTKGSAIQLLKRRNIEIGNNNKGHKFVRKEDVYMVLLEVESNRKARSHDIVGCALSQQGAFTAKMIADKLKTSQANAGNSLLRMYRAGKLKRKYMADYGYVYIVRKEAK